MTRMATDFFAQSPVLGLPILALLVFAAVFVAVSVRALRTPRSEIDRNASLPLTEDSHG